MDKYFKYFPGEDPDPGHRPADDYFNEKPSFYLRFYTIHNNSKNDLEVIPLLQ